MKTKKLLYYILMALPLIINVTALFFLPEKIPAHYGANNEVTRWGSKYEVLILPVITIPFGFFMLLMGKLAVKNGSSDKSNEKVTVLGGLAALAVFNVMNLYFLYAGFKQVTNLSEVSVDLYSLLFTVMGIGFIVIGNIMPKAKLNSIVGLRTSWSMKNEITWRKCQFFGGISLIVVGVLLMIGCVFVFRGMEALIWALVLVGIMTVVDIIYSYQIAKKY